MSKKFLLWIFAISAVLRLGFIWIAPAWYDESFTLLVTRLPFAQMLQAIAGDVHPPLWYLLLWPLGQLHAPIWVLRIPAALLSLASVWIFYRILQELGLPQRIQMAALLLMAIMPIQLYYAQEARMYALLEFLVLAAFLTLLRRKWAWYGLACALMLYTQYYAIFYIAALDLIILFRYKNEDLTIVRAVLANCVAALIFTPWLGMLLTQMGALSGSYWMLLTGPGQVLQVLFQVLFLPPTNAVIQIPLLIVFSAWLIIALFCATHYYWNNSDIGEIAILAFLPFFLALGVSLLWQPVLHYRPLIGISPFLYILFAIPVELLFQADLPILSTATISGIFILPALLICDGNLYFNASAIKTPNSALELAYIQSHWQPGDIILHTADDFWVNSAAALTEAQARSVYMSPDCGPVLGGLSPLTRQAIGEQIAPLADLVYRRAWIVWSDGPLDPACILSAKPAGSPLVIGADDQYVYDALWLVHK